MITREKALLLMKEHRMPDNVVRHSLLVNKIAIYLARKLKEKGEAVNEELVDVASLLHDIGKKYELELIEKYHWEIGYEIIKDISPEIANIVRKHALVVILKNELKTWEEKIVFYADKRASSDKIVSLAEEFRQIKKRYGKKISKEVMINIEKCEPLVIELEKEIFNKIREDPKELAFNI